MANELSARALDPEAPSEDEYEALCAALSASARGRAFLAEYARRQRAADTAMLMAAMERLEGLVRYQAPPRRADAGFGRGHARGIAGAARRNPRGAAGQRCRRPDRAGGAACRDHRAGGAPARDRSWRRRMPPAVDADEAAMPPAMADDAADAEHVLEVAAEEPVVEAFSDAPAELEGPPEPAEEVGRPRRRIRPAFRKSAGSPSSRRA